MLKLYPDQQDGVDKIHAAFKDKIKRVCYQLPTGGGKTVVFTHIASLVAAKFKRVVIITHRQELLKQGGGTLLEFGIKPQIITSKTKYVRESFVSVAMTGTLKNRLNRIKWRKWWDEIDLIIVDETHRSEFHWLADFDKGKFKLGVSATPSRSGKMPQLHSEYETLITGLQVRELIKLGRLVPDYYVGVPVDISGVSKDNKGEFSNNQLFEKFNNTKTYSGIVENWIEHANGLCTIVFCVNIQHCIETAKALNEAGIGAKFITSKPSKPNEPKNPEEEDPASWTKYRRKTKEYNNYMAAFPLYSGEREQTINDWKRDKFPVLINAGIAVEGFDHRPIMCVVVYLATTSGNKWSQMTGRGSRTFPGKEEFILMDFGGNADRLGHYQQNKQFSLTYRS
jgi:superfamily II DNA or RNA helicase